jgi:hypothetical protein
MIHDKVPINDLGSADVVLGHHMVGEGVSQQVGVANITFYPVGLPFLLRGETCATPVVRLCQQAHANLTINTSLRLGLRRVGKNVRVRCWCSAFARNLGSHTKGLRMKCDRCDVFNNVLAREFGWPNSLLFGK